MSGRADGYQGPTNGKTAQTFAELLGIVTHPAFRIGFLDARAGRAGEASAERTYEENGSTNFAMKPGQRRGDSGSAARFFYSAKASKADRAGSKHPTVKPVSLKQWLARMITPPGGLILDPFAGSGTTGQAALMEGFRAILCEREPEYQDDIRRRISEFMARSEQAEAEESRQADFFIEKPKPLKQEAFEL